MDRKYRAWSQHGPPLVGVRLALLTLLLKIFFMHRHLSKTQEHKPDPIGPPIVAGGPCCDQAPNILIVEDKPMRSLKNAEQCQSLMPGFGRYIY